MVVMRVWVMHNGVSYVKQLSCECNAPIRTSLRRLIKAASLRCGVNLVLKSAYFIKWSLTSAAVDAGASQDALATASVLRIFAPSDSNFWHFRNGTSLHTFRAPPSPTRL
jgi:hypothetical protein